MMHALFTSAAHCSSLHSKVCIPHTHTIQTTVRMHPDVYSSSQSQVDIPQIQTPHNTQNTTDIKMHIWIASDAHCSSQLYPLYISAYTPSYTQTTIDIKMDANFTSEVHRSSSQANVYILTYVQCSNYNSHHDARVVRKWCTLFQSHITSVYSTCTHHIILKLL